MIGGWWNKLIGRRLVGQLAGRWQADRRSGGWAKLEQFDGLSASVAISSLSSAYIKATLILIFDYIQTSTTNMAIN